MIRRVRTAEDLEQFRILVGEYVTSLGFSLEFQDIDAEMSHLGEEYGPPGGCALLAVAETGAAPAPAPRTTVGCVAVRPLEPPAVAELKRMYVRPSARGRGIGTVLGSAALEAARDLGYRAVRLDTVADMEAAAAVYERLGFSEIAPYRHNPLPGARFYQVKLAPPTRRE